MFDAVVRWRGSSFPCSALIDSGAEGNFIDESWAIEHGIPLHELSDPPPAFALDQGWANFLAQGTHWVLKFDRGPAQYQIIPANIFTLWQRLREIQ